MTKYDDVKVICTGEIGMIVAVKDGRYLVDFDTHTEWYDDCDLMLVDTSIDSEEWDGLQ